MRDHLLMSPISIVELLSQLASGDGTEALSAIQAIVERAEVALEGVDVDKGIDRLNALYVYETCRLNTPAADNNYNVKKHKNDILDAEQLTSLAYPDLNFLTCDKGFKRAAASAQFGRIPVVPRWQATENDGLPHTD